jgi:uncharacterized protein (TIGR04255 family)
MSKFPHLTRAPVVEALIDFRVRSRANFDLKVLEDLHSRINDRYPTSKPLQQVVATFGVKDGQPAAQQVVQTPKGYRFEAADTRLVVQMTTDGCTVSRLKPYETWEKLIEETRLIWELYVATAQPEAVIRVATRFINRIELPLPFGDFDEYLTAPPVVPKRLPQFVSEFLSRMVVNDPKDQTTIILTQALEPVIQTTNTLPILLDIDVFKVDTCAPRAKDLWGLLDKFRDLKNEAFFASLTPKALEMLA